VENPKKKKKKNRGMDGSKYVLQVLRQVLRGPLREFVKEMETEQDRDMFLVEVGPQAIGVSLRNVLI
jgi:hypothetical protein